MDIFLITLNWRISLHTCAQTELHPVNTEIVLVGAILCASVFAVFLFNFLASKNDPRHNQHLRT